MSTGPENLEDALRRVQDNADPVWWEAAVRALHALALDRTEFTPDDLWTILAHPREPRALGPVMLFGARRQWILRTSRTVKSVRDARNCGDSRVWMSLLWLP